MQVHNPSLHFLFIFQLSFFQVSGILIVTLILQWVGVSKITSGVRTMLFGQRGQPAPVPVVQVAGANPA